jgi:hypothetical protein
MQSHENKTHPILLFPADGTFGGTAEAKLIPCAANAVEKAITGTLNLKQEKGKRKNNASTSKKNQHVHSCYIPSLLVSKPVSFLLCFPILYF